MANSYDLYTGDGTTTQYAVNFPFLSVTHVKVKVNEIPHILNFGYRLSGSTVTFDDAPEINDAIEIYRETSPSNTLVDFINGSVLNESDLDTAYLHNFYLTQEFKERYDETVRQALVNVATGVGIVETETDAVIAALVNEMLDSTAAATLQQRVADIDTNAEAIISLGESIQVQINTLATGIASVIYIQPGEPVPGVAGIPDPIAEGARWYDSDDNNAAYIYISSAWVSITDPRIGAAAAAITILQADVGDNSAAIVDEAVARANADTAIATELHLIGVQNGAGTAFIIDSNTVKIDSDGGDTLATRLTALATADSTNASSITTEQSARISADSAAASVVSAIDARVTTAEAGIVSEASTRASADTALSGTITALTSTVDLKSRTFAQDASPTATATGDLWIDTNDSNKLYRWSGSAWVAVRDAGIAGNASAITAIDTRVTTAEGTITSHSSSITTLNASVSTIGGDLDTAEITIAAHVTAISTAQSDITAAEGDITSLYARYGVTLDVDGYITGFAQNNDGDTGNFVILADNFAIVDPVTELSVVTWDGTAEKLTIKGSLDIDNADQTFTPTWSGFSTAPTGDISYMDLGKVVFMWSSAAHLGTSNAATMGFTGIPTAIRPADQRIISVAVMNGGFAYTGAAYLQNDGSISFELGSVSGSLLTLEPGTSAFSTSGYGKGLPSGWTMTYSK